MSHALPFGNLQQPTAQANASEQASKPLAGDATAVAVATVTTNQPATGTAPATAPDPFFDGLFAASPAGPSAGPSSAEDAQAVADAAALRIVFPETGLIDPNEQVEKLRRLALSMHEAERLAFPDKVRKAILAHNADPAKTPEVSDHDLCLAIFIQRMSDSPLTNAQLEIKANGGKKPTKAKQAKSTLSDLLGLADTLPEA